MVKKLTSAAALCLAAILCFAALDTANSVDDSLATKCAAAFQKVTMCLPYATAKAAAPSTECCGAVTDLRSTDPACLCFIIQQVHNGTNAAVKSMGVQESRLLQLPSACRVANASVADCPRLLHLAPNSPDAVIFTNSSATTTAPVTSSSPSTASPSGGFQCSPQIGGSVVVSVVIFFLAFPSSFMSNY